MEDSSTFHLIEKIFQEIQVQRDTAACYFSGPIAECTYIGCNRRTDCVNAEIDQAGDQLAAVDPTCNLSELHANPQLAAWC
jgi:hypothetical protein